MTIQISPSTDLSTIPMGMNPSGAPTNFVDPASLAAATYGVVISLIVVSIPFVIIRIYNNWTQYSKLGVDDCESVSGKKQ
jgi:hypothetical protein